MILKLSHESNSLNGLQFGVETKEIWSFEVKLRREYAVTGLHTSPILFACLGSSFGPFLGLKVAKLWLLYRSFFWQVLMPNIGVKLKTIGFDSQLESCENYPLAMGSLFEYFLFYAYCLYCM